MIDRRLGTVLTPLLAAILLGLGVLHGAQAQTDGGWTPIGPGGPILQVFTPTSGALFVWSPAGLFRSDDAGTTWSRVTVPASTYRVEVNPTDHTILYAAGAGGLAKSSDDAATWTVVLPTTENVRAIAVSPADHSLVYVGLTGSASSSPDFRFLRSRDSGGTWEELEQFHNTLCGWDVHLLEPHPTDQMQVFRTASCYSGRSIGGSLSLSTDQGATWSVLLRPDAAYPDRLVGGQGVTPGRFYLASNRDPRAGGSLLHRSDDGRAWTEILDNRAGGTVDAPDAAIVTIGGLAYDPAVPDHVYVGLNTQTHEGDPQLGAVQASSDGGATWTVIGHDLGQINDLALGIDGLNLYAATNQGLWRLAVQIAAAAGPRSTLPRS